jgi:histidinol-phosphate aminotransferase
MPLDEDAQAINNKLLREGVIIRPMGPREIRVTIGLPEENKRFIGALRKVVNR